MITPAQIREVEEFLREHAAFMTQPPVPYRGYEIRPVSYKHQPFFIKGEFVYQGFNIVADGLNKGPGAIWFRTIEDAKVGIDCIHEAGGHGRHWKDYAWFKAFWELIQARFPTEA